MAKENNTGIIRGIDNLGRVVLPKELRTALGLTGDSKVEIFAEGACTFCGAVDEQAVTFEGRCICRDCRQRIAALRP